MKKRIICALLCVILAATTLGAFTPQAAVNVTLNKNAVYISGYPDNTFKPENKMTRAEAIKTVAVICGYKSSFDSASVETKFADIK